MNMMGGSSPAGTAAAFDALLRLAEILQDPAKLAKLREEFQELVRISNEAAAAAQARIDAANLTERANADSHAERCKELANRESQLTEAAEAAAVVQTELNSRKAKLAEGAAKMAKDVARFEAECIARSADLDAAVREFTAQHTAAEQAASARESALNKRERDLDARQQSSERALAARESAVVHAEQDVAAARAEADALTAKLKATFAKLGELAAAD